MVELETRVAFQDHTLAVLNETVVEQARALSELGRRFDLAMQDLEKLRTLLMADPSHEPPPPHY